MVKSLVCFRTCSTFFAPEQNAQRRRFVENLVLDLPVEAFYGFSGASAEDMQMIRVTIGNVAEASF